MLILQNESLLLWGKLHFHTIMNVDNTKKCLISLLRKELISKSILTEHILPEKVRDLVKLQVKKIIQN